MALVWALVGFGLLRVLLLLGFIVVLVCIRLDWCFGLVWFGALLGLVWGGGAWCGSNSRSQHTC